MSDSEEILKWQESKQIGLIPKLGIAVGVMVVATVFYQVVLATAVIMCMILLIFLPFWLPLLVFLCMKVEWEVGRSQNYLVKKYCLFSTKFVIWKRVIGIKSYSNVAVEEKAVFNVGLTYQISILADSLRRVSINSFTSREEALHFADRIALYTNLKLSFKT